MTTPHDVTGFWLSQDAKAWFSANPAFDREIAERFGPCLDDALAGRLDHWADTAPGALGLVIVLDQFSRNIHRGGARAFAGDEHARRIARRAIDRGFDQLVDSNARAWLYMPFMHSEHLSDQELSVRLFSAPGLESNLAYAIEHADIIRRFGRFPHRNAILGRTSTPAEEAFLAAGGFAG